MAVTFFSDVANQLKEKAISHLSLSHVPKLLVKTWYPWSILRKTHVAGSNLGVEGKMTDRSRGLFLQVRCW